MRLRWWLHRRLSLVALYLYASATEQLWEADAVALATVVLFALLLPLPDWIDAARGHARGTYASAWRAGMTGGRICGGGASGGKGAITAVDAATFQKSAEYAPATRGASSGDLETLLIHPCCAVSACDRRQFRR